MATNKLKPSKEKQARYTTYKLGGNLLANYKRKIARHLKKHPNDEVAKQALKSGVPTPRKAPTKKLGWVLSGSASNLRKEQAYSNAKVSKLSSKVLKMTAQKVQYKNITLNPFFVLNTLKGTLPAYNDPTEAKKKQRSYSQAPKRMKAR